MGTASLPDPPGFHDLSKAQQIEYLQDLWDRLSADSREVAVRGSHVELLEARLAEHRLRPEGAAPAREIVDRLASRKR